MYEAKRNGKARFVVFHEGLSSNGAPAVQEEAVEPEDYAAPAEEQEAAPELEPEVHIETDAEIEIHREPLADAPAEEEPVTAPAPEEPAAGEDNGQAPEADPRIASSLSEARRRRRQRFPPR
jgi:hypothetical protein